MIKKIIYLFLLVLIILSAWQLLENLASADRISRGETSLEAFIPSPLSIAETYRTEWPMIIREMSYTLSRAGIGFFLGTCFAIMMAAVFSFIPSLRNLFFPFSFALNSFPIIGLAPAIILFFGQGSWISIIFISALISYFPILLSLDRAFQETDKEILDMARVLNASRAKVFWKIRFPLALPYLLLAMRLAIPASIIGATMGEWLGTRNGIGQLITIALYQLKPGILYASLLLITGVSVGAVLLLKLLEYLLFPWRRDISN